MSRLSASQRDGWGVDDDREGDAWGSEWGDS
jgi:hypothetical protein